MKSYSKKSVEHLIKKFENFNINDPYDEEDWNQESSRQSTKKYMDIIKKLGYDIIYPEDDCFRFDKDNYIYHFHDLDKGLYLVCSREDSSVIIIVSYEPTEESVKNDIDHLYNAVNYKINIK